MPNRVSRRELLAGAIAPAAMPAAAGRARAQGADTTRQAGSGASPLGARSPHMTIRRDHRGPVASRTPLQDLQGTITPSDLHFERHHAGIPAVDPDDYRLLVHGMVERPMVLGQLPDGGGARDEARGGLRHDVDDRVDRRVAGHARRLRSRQDAPVRPSSPGYSRRTASLLPRRS